MARSLRYWKVPLWFGSAFCALQVLVALARFGLDGTGPLAAWPWLLLGLAVFFAGGLLAGLLVQRLLRGVTGAWRAGLLGATGLATLLAVYGGLLGGLLGPGGTVAFTVVPYLLLVGVPASIRSLWLRWGTSRQPRSPRPRAANPPHPL